MTAEPLADRPGDLVAYGLFEIEVAAGAFIGGAFIGGAFIGGAFIRGPGLPLDAGGFPPVRMHGTDSGLGVIVLDPTNR